jgi:hypothetical protein
MKTKYQAKPMPTRPAALLKSRKSKTTTVAKQFPFSLPLLYHNHHIHLPLRYRCALVHNGTECPFELIF